MRLLLTTFTLLSLATITASQASSTKVSLDDLRFLIGDWEAVGGGGPGMGKGGFSFAFDLQNKIIVRKNFAEYPATEGRPATTHQDLMVIYVDNSSNQILANFFDTEGHQITYKVASASAGKAVTFVSEPSQTQPRYRLSYDKLKDGTLKGTFEIAPPGRPEAFKNYL